MNQTTQETLPGFKRAGRVGFNIIGFKAVGDVLFVKVLDRCLFTKKDGDTIEYAKVIDLKTGEDSTMWLDGALKYNLDQMLAKKGDYGFALEIRYDGQKSAMVYDQTKKQDVEREINTYSFWELSEDETKSHN